jgi:signal transduction histidine kinase
MKIQTLSFLSDGFHQNVIILLVFAFLIRPAFSHTLAITCVASTLWAAVVFIQCSRQHVVVSTSKLFLDLSSQALTGSLICRGAWLIETHARSEFRHESTVPPTSNDSNELVRERYLRLKAEAKAEADNGFVAYLCHEIRNPFNGIVGYAEFTVDQIRGLLEGQAYAKQCVEQLASGEYGGESPQQQQLMQQQQQQLLSNMLQASSDVELGNHQQMKQVDGQTAALMQVQEWCSRILECSGHVSEILDNALDLSKLEAGNLVLHNQPLNMHQLVHEVFLLLNSTIQSPKVEFQARVKEDLWVLGDRLRWKQLLVNIVSNAFKFTKKGFVRVGIELTPALGLLVEVCDTGPGIAKDDYKLLFSKYSQVGIRIDGSLRKVKKRKGTGLGLAIAQLIARLLGAEIQVESPWTRGWPGSRFFFYVPPRHAIQCDPPSDDDEMEGSDDDRDDDDSSTDAAEAAELAGGDVWRVALPERVVQQRRVSSTSSKRNGSGSGSGSAKSGESGSGGERHTPSSGFSGGGAPRLVTMPPYNKGGEVKSGSANSSNSSGGSSGGKNGSGGRGGSSLLHGNAGGFSALGNTSSDSGGSGSTFGSGSPHAAHKQLLRRMSGSGDNDLLGSNETINSSTGSVTMHTLTHKEGHTLVSSAYSAVTRVTILYC